MQVATTKVLWFISNTNQVRNLRFLRGSYLRLTVSLTTITRDLPDRTGRAALQLRQLRAHVPAVPGQAELPDRAMNQARVVSIWAAISLALSSP